MTLTTVGYGDSFPVTHMGQAMGIFTMVDSTDGHVHSGVRVAIDDHRLWQLLGIITLALPISIIGGSFIDERNQMLEREAAEDLKSRNTMPKTAVSCCDRRLAINMLCSTREEVKNYCSLSREWKIHWKEWTTATMS